jgi:hypothetical protein
MHKIRSRKYCIEFIYVVKAGAMAVSINDSFDSFDSFPSLWIPGEADDDAAPDVRRSNLAYTSCNLVPLTVVGKSKSPLKISSEVIEPRL